MPYLGLVFEKNSPAAGFLNHILPKSTLFWQNMESENFDFKISKTVLTVISLEMAGSPPKGPSLSIKTLLKLAPPFQKALPMALRWHGNLALLKNFEGSGTMYDYMVMYIAYLTAILYVI